MGKPGKKAGKGMLPPTNPKRQTDGTKSHLRDQRTIRRLKMYTSKIKRDDDGNIIKGSVLAASDRTDQSMARVAPDRRWFGNTRVIGQEALQKFRTELGAKYKDPYSVVVKQSKLPLSLLEEPKAQAQADKSQMDWSRTFGDKAQRKRVRLRTATLGGLKETADTSLAHYSSGTAKKDRDVVRDTAAMHEDRSINRSLFKKGQSNRIWNELFKVIDSADVILYVVDARDPAGTRSKFIEHFMRTEKKFKHFVFVLNKCDLIPLWATARWIQTLSKEFPTVAFHASINHPFGKGNLISLLRQFSRLHNVACRGKKKTPISVGVIGYPNVGKSSIINTLKRKTVCRVAPIPGETKVWQYVALTRSIFLIDCPGVVYDREGNSDVQAVLKGVVRIERLGDADKTEVMHEVLKMVRREDIVATYKVPDFTDANDFLAKLALRRGKLTVGGVPDGDSVARSVLYDWQRGKVPWFVPPPFDSQAQRERAQTLPPHALIAEIESAGALQVQGDRLESALDAAAADALTAGAPADGDAIAPVTEEAGKVGKKRRRSATEAAAAPAAPPKPSADDLWAAFVAAA